MNLPTITAPKHKTILPISKKEVIFRPFLVKEEKIMIIADGSDSDQQIEMAISQVIDNCTFGKIANTDRLCQLDLEWLILQIRGESKGFSVDLMFQCTNEIAVRDEVGNKHETDKMPCHHKNEIVGDLKTVFVDGGTESPLIDLGNGLGIKMKIPDIGVLAAIGKLKESEIEAGFSNIMACIESIYNEESVWLATDLSREELSDFIESFNEKQFEKIKDWVDNIPSLKLTVDYQCQSCGVKDTITIDGLDNFFG